MTVLALPDNSSTARFENRETRQLYSPAKRHSQRNEAAEGMADEGDGFARPADDPFQRLGLVNN